MERRVGLLWLALLPLQILRSHRYIDHSKQGQEEQPLADISPCRSDAVHVGRHSIHVPTHLDVCPRQLWNPCHHGRSTRVSYVENLLLTRFQYTFYLFSALGVRVPKWFKQTLTTLQITQFVVGAAYAFLHLFIAYQIPVSVPYIYHLGTAATKIASSVPIDISATASSAIATVSAGVGAWLKKAALRAAGYEGLAENVLNEQGQTFGIDAVHAAEDLVAREETRYRDEVQWVHCLDTSGQVFAILLNCMYLLPLTWLFLQFFITSYIKRVDRRRSSTASEKALVARQSLQDASKGLARRLSEALEEMHQVTDDIGEEDAVVDGDEVKAELRDLANQANSTYQKGVKKAKETASKVDLTKVQQELQRDLASIKENLQDTAEKTTNAIKSKTGSAAEVKKNLQDAAGNAANAIKSKTGSLDEIKENLQGAAEKATNVVKSKTGSADEVKEKVAETAKKTADTAKQSASKASQSTKETAAEAQKAAGKAKDKTADSANKASEQAKKTSEKAEDKAAEGAKKTSEEGKKTAGKSKDKAAEGADKASKKAKDEEADAKKSPNGNGTGAGEATGRSSSKTEETNGDEDTSEVKEGKSFADAVKEEDDETSEVQEGKSFADAVKE